MTGLTAASEIIIAPSTDSSASRFWGGTLGAVCWVAIRIRSREMSPVAVIPYMFEPAAAAFRPLHSPKSANHTPVPGAGVSGLFAAERFRSPERTPQRAGELALAVCLVLGGGASPRGRRSS